MSIVLNTKSRVMGDCQARFRERLEVQFLRPTRQYFLGLEAFTYEQVMTPSLLVSIRKRIDLDVFESLTDDLIRKGLKLKAGVNPDEVSTEVKDDDEDDHDDPDPHPGNKGKLQMDATVCDADIKYPTDLDLLNKSRQKAEELIDELCSKLGVQDKPRTYRRVARKEFLNVSKMKRKPANVLRKAIRKQINYLKRDIRIINEKLDTIKDEPIPFDRGQMKYFFVIRHLLEQQETMYKKRTHQVDKIYLTRENRRNAIRWKESLVRANVDMV